MNMHWHRGAALLAVLAAMTTACSVSAGTNADHESTPASTGTATPPEDPTAIEPVELRLGTGDAKNAPSGDQIRWFAKRVAELTDGQIHIKPVYLSAGHVADFEPVVAKQVIEGDLDLALVASRAWDTLGVRTLSPLQAPFLVTSDEHTAHVVSGPIEDDLLADLPEIGVVGLGLWPEALRHPFGFDAPLNEPADYAGALIRAANSEATKEMFRALGARTTTAAPDPSSQRGAESAYRLAPAGTATANVVFYPKVNALVANADADAAMTDEQRAALAQAVEDTQAWVIDTMPTDNEAARAFCEEGGDIQSASPAQAKAMYEATRPVSKAMAADATLGPIIDEITEAGVGITPENPIADCRDATDAEALARLNGDYTVTVTAAAGRKAGVTDPEVLDNGSGKYVAHLKDGTWTLDQTYTEGPNKGTSDTVLGDYTVRGNQFTWYWSHEPGQNVTMAFRILPDGSLAFSKVVSKEGGDWAKMATAHFTTWKRVYN
jgi:TRAP-type C4-dicarboxylate transport system substrate-binding protein